MNRNETSKAEKTTITIRSETKEIIDSFKLVSRETYDDVIRRVFMDAIESNFEVNDETKKILDERLQQVKEGKVISLNDVLRRLKENDI